MIVNQSKKETNQIKLKLLELFTIDAILTPSNDFLLDFSSLY